MNKLSFHPAKSPVCLALVALLHAACLLPATAGPPGTIPEYDDSGEIASTASKLRNAVERFEVDEEILQRNHDLPLAESDRRRMERFYRRWQETLDDVQFKALDVDGRIDWILLTNLLERRLAKMRFDRTRDDEILEFLPFCKTVIELQEARRQIEPVEPREAAGKLVSLREDVDEKRNELKKRLGSDTPRGEILEPSRARRAAQRLEALARELESWHGFYDGYDPDFSWWTRKPYESAIESLRDYEQLIRRELVGEKPGEPAPLVGEPLGREALVEELAREFIPYSPEELLTIAEREFDWCDREMLRASRDLGFGDDWRKAMDHVKDLHVPPGEQPELIRKLADEAVAFLDQRDLLTIPDLARHSWRMRMMSPRRQQVSPYFTGGEVISVSYPTDTMTHADKLMSMRGNNIHFSRATVHHELIPGHHLQLFMLERFNTHRRPFRTPFWVEGWALYWEMQLWDLDFPRSAADRVGFLFWRRHRCARIIFSLSYHLKKMTAEECVDFLLERVGHERKNATAEVRRSIIGGYSPLYQAAYMLGGLQIRGLYEELVQSAKMTAREFHDALLRQGAIPIELIRAKLTGQKLTRDFQSTWKFYGDVAVEKNRDDAEE